MSLNAPAIKLPQGWQIRHFKALDSTNTRAHELALAGEPSRLWVLADQQSAARGSRGRNWVSMEGNLFASLLLRDPAPLSALSNLAFVAVLAVEATLRHCFSTEQISTPQIALKWPNDVLVDGKKVSGILLENHKIEGQNCVIVGIGINIADCPDKALYPATALARHGLEISRNTVFEELARQFETMLAIWQGGKGFGDIRTMWLARAKGFGERLIVQTGIAGSGNNEAKTHEGIFREIDEGGALVLQCDDGTLQKVHVGDVFFSEEMRATD